MSILSSLRTSRAPSPDGYRRWLDTPTFSYKQWLENSCKNNDQGAIATIDIAVQPKVAIIGAGAAGLCAAYELIKCGFAVDVFEASPQAGGRMRSYNDSSWDNSTLAELGAMRFTTSEELLFYYLDLADPDNTKTFDEKYPPFPDPGTVQTSISYRDEKPIGWIKNKDNSPPQGFETVANGWYSFVGNPNDTDHTIYSKDLSKAPNLVKLSQIETYLLNGDKESLGLAQKAWQTYLTVFGALSFFDGLTRIFSRESVWHPPGLKYDPSGKDDINNTWTRDDFDRFGTLGVGSGGFSALYAIGFNTVVRLIPNGLETAQRILPKGTKELIDFFTSSPKMNVYYDTEIIEVKDYTQNDKPMQFILRDRAGPVNDNARYDEVIWATNLRAMSMSLALQPMLLSQNKTPLLTPVITSAINTTHVTSSSKLFLRTKAFWKGKDAEFPRVILSGMSFQQVYTIDYDETTDPDSPGMVLISYTWEDDSNQALPLDKFQRLELFKEEIHNIHPVFAESLLPFSNLETDLVMVDWQAEKYQYGAFALNRAGQDVKVQGMFYDYLKAKEYVRFPIYLAGDAISWCGGWVESALQTGLNAAAAVIQAHKGHFSASPTPMDMDPKTYDYSYTGGDENNT